MMIPKLVRTLGGVAAGLLFGCAAHRINLVDAGTAALHVEAVPGISLQADVYQTRGGFEVSGTARRPALDTRELAGHVDILVAGTDGVVLAAREVNYRHEAGRVRHVGVRHSFREAFPFPLPPGSQVQLRHHSPSRGGDCLS